MICSREVMYFVHAEPLSETSYQQILSELRQGGLSQTNQSGEHRPLNRSKSEVGHLQPACPYQGCRQLCNSKAETLINKDANRSSKFLLELQMDYKQPTQE